MAPESAPSNPGIPATNDSDNKYMRVLSLASARKRGRGNLDDDYRRPHYEPAKPPVSDDGAASPT